MRHVIGRLAGQVVLALLAFAATASVADADADAPPVHVLAGAGASSLAARSPGSSLAVPGRPPAPRFRGSLASPSSLRVAEAAEAGTRTNGKILAVTPGLGGYSCSGTAINTPSRSIVLTAGHCVLEGGRPGRRIAFVPAYDHGTRPFGTFRVEAVYVMPQWRRGNPDFDLAALRVGPNRLGLLTDVVGGRGYATSKSRLSALQIFGYPAAALRGEELRSCRAHGLGTDPLTNALGGPPTVPASCDMAAGASGGGWIVDGEYVNGVTSYAYVGRPTRLHSPYFGPQVAAFLRQVP
jgi:trypsin